MFLLGFVLYASTVLIPQFLQQLMGYDAEMAGLALSPGGLVILVMMPVVGMLISKIEARWLVMFGCVVCSLALFVMSGWNLGVSYGVVVRARMLQSFGMAFLFIPINVAAFSFVPKERTNMGTGIINLARNIGASIGIAFVTTMLERRAQFHQVNVASHIDPSNPAYRAMITNTAARLASVGSDPALAQQQAHGLLYGLVQRQSAMLSFVDDFWLLGVIFLLMIPALFFMKKATPPKGPVAVH
jgi:DHA2 family multidrug resistance protein